MSTALIPLFGWRRPFVTVHPGTSSVYRLPDGSVQHGTSGPVTLVMATHDQYYVQTSAAWKRRLLSGERLRETIAEFRQWQAREREWYRGFRLSPPSSTPRRRKTGSQWSRYRLAKREALA